MTVKILRGDCREILKTLPDQSVHCVVTSPPYWGLRDYGVDGQLGLERSLGEYIETMVGVFREVKRVLRDDGTLWLNMGDSYAGSWGNYGGQNRSAGKQRAIVSGSRVPNEAWDERTAFIPAAANCPDGLKPKDLCGIPWRLAFALQADGWWLRQDIIWAKPNPMPESVTDRCTKAHEYIFMLSKSARYFYDQDAIREPLAESSVGRLLQENFDNQTGGPKDYGHRTNSNRSARKALCNLKEKLIRQDKWGDRYDGWTERDKTIGRNKRSVWEIATAPFSEAHFATFPPALIEPCIKAGCPKGGTVLDPFGGAGTTGLVADRLSRDAVLIELNPEYATMAEKRIKGDAPLFVEIKQSSASRSACRDGVAHGT